MVLLDIDTVKAPPTAPFALAHCKQVGCGFHFLLCRCNAIPKCDGQRSYSTWPKTNVVRGYHIYQTAWLPYVVSNIWHPDCLVGEGVTWVGRFDGTVWYM